MPLFEFGIGILLVLLGLFVPGYCLVLGFYQKKTELLERILLSFAFSLVLIPLALVLLNKFFTIPIDLPEDVGIVVIFSVVGLIAWRLRKSKSKEIQK